MSHNLQQTAKNMFRRLGSGDEVMLYNNGSTLVLVGGEDLPFGHVLPKIYAERRLSSARQAESVHARFAEVLNLYPNLSPERALDHAIELARSAWRVANRRVGRRVP